MRVYLVCRYYEGTEGVYSTREKAEAYIGKDTADLYVEVWDVDQGEVEQEAH